MDEGGGSLLIDASQYGNNAPLTGGASWVSGVLGQAARFNGVSQYASVADNASLDMTGAITVAGWIQPEAVGTQYLVKKAQQHETNGYELSLAGSGYVFFRFNQFSSGDAYPVSSTTPYPTNGNTWMHVAATYDGQSLRMYINGTLNGSLSLPSSPAIAVNGLPLTIGAEAGGYRGLQGAMDDVRIYNTALSAAEILELGTLPPATAVPLPPVLALPLSGASGVLVEPELAWQSSDGASYYRVQVSRDGGFGNVVFDLNHLNEISISVEELAYSTAYYWRVRASNAGGTSAWSEVRGFTTEDLPVPPPSTPVLSLPQENAQDLPVSMDLVWDFAEGADYYHVQVATDEVFQDIHFDHTELIGTTVPISGLGFSSVYFWRVRAFNGAGEGPWSAVRRFTTMDAPPLPPAMPLQDFPGDGATGIPAETAIRWFAVEGADSYRFQLASDSSFGNVLRDSAGLVGTSVEVSGLASGADYFWRVRASNGYGDSNWSSVWSFTTSAAAPDSPLVGHWKMDEGGGNLLIDASQYGNNAPLTGGASWVSGVLGQAARFNGVSQYASVADNASLDITGAITVAGWIKPEAVGTQYLVKKAQQHETNGYELSLAGSGYVFFRFNQFSSGDAYRVNSTTPYPTNGNTWMHVAATYDGQSLRMYINGTLNGSLSLPSSPAIAVNGLPLTIGAEAGGYRGLQGAMDDVRIYNTALSAAEILELGTLPPATAVPLPPVLALPLSGASGVLVEPELAWQSSDGASYYRVQVSRDAGFGNVVFDLNHLNEISISVEELAYSTAYYWRVRASNAGGTSAWSEVRGFTTEDLPVPPPSTPVLSLPQENAQDLPVSMDLVWDFAEGADYYHVQVATDEVFQDIHFDHTELIGTTVPISGLGFSSVYFWRVRAFNGAGEGPWSAVRRFTTMDAPPLPPAMPLQDSPGDGATGIPAETAIRWFAVEDADSYRFQLASDSSFGNVLRDSAGLVGTSVEVSGLASGADYFWRVRASNGYGDSNWSSVWSFTTSAAAPDSPLVGH